MIKISVIIITYNNEDKIERCLKSIGKLSDDIIVVDSRSTDKTVEIANKYTDKIFIEDWYGYAKQKNIALSHTKHDWILWLDSDEELTMQAKTAIRNNFNNLQNITGCRLKRKTVFLGRIVDHCFGNDYVLRLFKKNKEICFSEEKELHEYLNIEGRIETLKDAVIMHYPYKDLDEYFEKFIKYVDLFAKQAIKENRKKVGFFKLFFAFPLNFIKLYIFKCGFLDGKQGFYLSVLSAMHNFVKYARLWELQK